MTEREQLEQAIVSQEKLHGALPDDIVDALIAIIMHPSPTYICRFALPPPVAGLLGL